MLLSFHYLVTSFFLAVWWQSFSWVLLIHFAFQTIWLLSGGSISNVILFWGWQTLVSILGAIAGIFVGVRPLFVLSDIYSWLYFICSLAVYVAIQLVYAYFPPFPGKPAGQQGLGLSFTLIVHLIIIGSIWYGVSREHMHRNLFFKWAVLTFIMEILFFIALSGWPEIWLAITLGGSIAILSVIFHFLQVKNVHSGSRAMVRRSFI